MRLVSLAAMTCVALGAPAVVRAQQSAPPSASRPFEIVDNSFLVEEAFNQEPGVFQNIFTATRADDGGWAMSFTQEWPAPGIRHQLSYTLVFDNVTGSGRMNNVALNYRYQLRNSDNGGLALAPRFSVLVRPDATDTDDAGRLGIEVNLPASRQFGNVYLHGNAGMRVYPSVERRELLPQPQGRAGTDPLTSPFLAASAIVRVRPMLHAMLETVLQYSERLDEIGTRRDTIWIVSPGTRFGWNVGEQQLVFGVAVPWQREEGRFGTSVLGYASWELRFRP
jgi:hypothetical protein